MGSKANSQQQAPVHWLREITKAQLSPFLFIKRGEMGNLDKFGQVRTRQQIRKMGGKAERIRKGEKLSGDGEEEKVGSRIHPL